MLLDIGLTVARSIPAKLLVDLAAGHLSIHGGVIRDASGKIVSHLVLPSSTNMLGLVPGLGAIGSVVNGIQIQALASNVAAVKAATDQVLNYTIAAATISGLGLVTSVAGFAYLTVRLNWIGKRLSVIEKQTKSIKQFLQSTQHAQLMTAVDHLRLSQQATDDQTRRHLLLQSKQLFTSLAHHYKVQLEEINDIAELSATEDCYVLACIGSVMTTSDLGMFDSACEDMNSYYDDWCEIARKHCGKLLLKNDPARLFDARYVKSIPSRNLIRFLDFTNDTNRGLEWLDELRLTLDKTTLVRSAVSVVDSSCIDYANKLLVKNDALQGFSAHMKFLAEKKLPITYFSQRVEQIRDRDGAKFLLLQHVVS